MAKKKQKTTAENANGEVEREVTSDSMKEKSVGVLE
jgi:hypothetical protein